MSLEQKAQILERILSLKDYSPFILICDSLAQTADLLIKEIEHWKDPSKEIRYIRELNDLPNVAKSIQQLIKPGVPVIGIFHTDKQLLRADQSTSYTPCGLPLLEYMATSIIRIIPSTLAQQRIADDPSTGSFDFSGSVYNHGEFELAIEHRRKTGRSLTGSFSINSDTHKIKFLSPMVTKENEIPENLTTFNLSLNEKQKKDRENLILPFMEAQSGPEGGGAIVYQYEKDDDYDEEDPYEDPF